MTLIYAHDTALQKRAKNITEGVLANCVPELVDLSSYAVIPHPTFIITFIHGLLASITMFPLGRDSDYLRAGLSGDRGSDFSRMCTLALGAHPAFYTIGSGAFSGVNRPGQGVNHLPLSSKGFKEKY